MRQVNLDQVRALIEVVRFGSFTAAAHELHLTQPAVSLQVQELEQRFGVKLVERLGRRVRPTAAGSELAAHGQEILERCEEVNRSMRRYRDGFIGQSRIGMSMTVLIYLMPPVIRRLRAELPSLELVVRTGFSEATVQGVRDGTLDIGLCTGPISEKAVECIPLLADQIVAIFPREQDDLPDAVEPNMMGRWPLVLGNQRSALRRLVASWIGTAGPVQRPIMELDNIAGIKSVVGAGLGMSLVPALSVHEADSTRIAVRNLEPPIVRDLLLVQRADRANEAAVRHVREALLSHLRSSPRD